MYFNKEKIRKMRNQTPYFLFDREALLTNLKEYQILLPQETEICYAMKANSEKIVLETLNNANASFEVASKYELRLLKDLKVNPGRITFGTSVKPESHIKEFAEYGVDRFAFDSEEELEKIAKHAPGSRVFVRVLVDDRSNSVFHLSEKFGASLESAVELLVKAKNLGLIPYGISFNVGSQARNREAWARGVRDVARVMKALEKEKIRIKIINLGGGFPYSYQEGDSFPSIKEISEEINKAVKELPYRVDFLAEPGRGLVADCFSLVTSVIAKNKRANGHWLFLDAGVYNAMLEAMTCQGSTHYSIELLSSKHDMRNIESYIVTGPTGDNLDVINKKEKLPADIKNGDKLIIQNVGAYTFTLMTRFNGFPKPKIVEIKQVTKKISDKIRASLRKKWLEESGHVSDKAKKKVKQLFG